MQHKKASIAINYERIIITVLLLQVFAIQWLNLTFYYSLFVDIIILGYIVVRWKKIHRLGISFVPLFAFLLYGAFNTLRTNCDWKVLVTNLYQVITSLLIIIIIPCLNINRIKLEKYFKKLFPLINLYMIINIPVLVLQLNDHFELSGRHPALYTNNYKPDLISGLFGYNGTPFLAAFSSFFFVYDIWYYRNHLKNKHKLLYIVYYLGMLVFYLFISTRNDNKGFFPEITLFFVIYYLSLHNNYKKIAQRLRSGLKGIAFLVVVMLGAITAYNIYEPFEKLINKLFIALNYGSNETIVIGGAERFGMISYFFRENINKLIGVGVGTIRWKERLGFGFIHFGQNDMGPFLLLGGILLVCLVFWVFINSIKHLNDSKLIIICESILLLILIIYTQALTSISIIISLMLFTLICFFEKQDVKKQGANKN